MSNPAKAVNAWIYLSEDEPPNTVYASLTSCYQTLIQYGVYRHVDMLGICFFATTGTAADLTLEIKPYTHNPGGYTNDQYLAWVTRDARAANPDIKLLATLDWGTNWLAPLFTGPRSGWQAQVDTFAANLTTYLTANGLDGFDLDWEPPISAGMDSSQFAMLFQAIRAAFDTVTAKHLYLTLCPATTENVDAPTINTCFDYCTLQLYFSTALRDEYIKAGVDPAMLAYGAKFESNFQDAQDAYQGYEAHDYGVIMQWRLNSSNYQFEQAQQMLLYQLIWPSSGVAFDDSNIAGAAGNPPLTQLVVRAGNVVDAIQATSTGTPGGSDQGDYYMAQHGGNGGSAYTVSLNANDPITQISGFTGVWFGWHVVLQVKFQTRSGQAHGPFGTMANATAKVPFNFTAPPGQSIVAFKGTTRTVPEYGAPPSAVIASLGWTTA